MKVNYNRGYGSDECSKYLEKCDWYDWWCHAEKLWIDCSPSSRISLTAEVWFILNLFCKMCDQSLSEIKFPNDLCKFVLIPRHQKYFVQCMYTVQ